MTLKHLHSKIDQLEAAQAMASASAIASIEVEEEPGENPPEDENKVIPFVKFCREYLKIQKRGAGENEGLIPFDKAIWTKGQKRLAALLVKLRKQKKAIRVIVHKSRQRHGASTIVEAFLFWLIYWNPDRTAAVAAHEQNASRSIFGNVHRFTENLPVERRRPLVSDKVMRQKIEYARPHSSICFCATAGNVQVFRSFHIQYFHGSEVDFYASAEDFFQAVNPCFPDVHETWDSVVIKESTARCRGYFYEECKKAQDGTSEYIFFFMSWKDEPHCRIPLEEGETLELTQELSEYQQTYGLDDEQMKWAIARINNDCHGRLEIFNQEYPVESKLAFAYTGRPAFSSVRIEESIASAEPVVLRGDIEWASQDRHSTKLIEATYGPLWIWKMPEPGKTYLMSIDVGEGVHADLTEVQMLAYDSPLEQVAMWRSNRVKPGEAAVVGFRLGAFYGYPMAVIEKNGPGLLVLDVFLEGHSGYPQTAGGYPNVYYRVRYDRKTKETTSAPGFYTLKDTRSAMIDRFRELFDEGMVKVNSIISLDQMAGFAWDAQARKYIANHTDPETKLLNDDSIMSLGIGTFVMTGDGQEGRSINQAAIGALPVCDF